jgi:hypothetical protein
MQELYHWNYTPSLFICILFLRTGLANFAWASLELTILLPGIIDMYPHPSFLLANVSYCVMI